MAGPQCLAGEPVDLILLPIARAIHGQLRYGSLQAKSRSFEKVAVRVALFNGDRDCSLSYVYPRRV
jgi:hypothetical protein